MSMLFGAGVALVKMIKQGTVRERFEYLKNYINDFIVTKKIKPYYVKEKGNRNILHFTIEILIAVVVYIIEWRYVIL